jgi:hypothetical protein
MKRHYLFCITILFLLSVSAINFGISPKHIEIMTYPESESCANFTLTGDRLVVFTGEVLWSNYKTKNINDYTFSSEEVGIRAVYPKIATPGTWKICCSSKAGGKHFGALLYRVYETNYGIGTWVDLEIEKSTSGRPSLITTFAIEELPTVKHTLFGLGFLLLILLLILLMILVHYKNQ